MTPLRYLHKAIFSPQRRGRFEIISLQTKRDKRLAHGSRTVVHRQANAQDLVSIGKCTSGKGPGCKPDWGIAPTDLSKTATNQRGER